MIQLKVILSFLLTFFILFGLIYLILSLTQWSFIVDTWHYGVRYTLASFGIIDIVISAGITAQLNNTDK